MSQTQHESMISSLVGIVGADHVLDDEESRSLFSTDLFYDGAAPMCIVSPATPEELAQTVRTLTMGGCAIVPRGGGLSYSAGYVANRADAVLLDMRRLNRIVEINEDDLFVTVETGITWSALNDALEAKGLRTPFWGTGSGKYATVGGALSQHAINFGTGQFGLAAQSVLGLSVVTADGSVLVTGSGGTNENPTPFFRHYGPDLTGLFVGDCGALGIKAKATLQLIRRPPATLHASFEYETIDAFQRAISEVARCHVVSECFGFDPSFPNMRTTYAGIKDGLKLLAGVAKTQGSVLSGVKEAVSVAVAGDSYLKDLGYSIHVTVDGRDEADAHSKSRFRKSCGSGQSADEEHDGGGVEEGAGRGDGGLEVLCQSPVAVDPGEEALHDPAARLDGEADLIGAFAHDLDGDHGGRGDLLAGVAAIGKDLLDERKRAA